MRRPLALAISAAVAAIVSIGCGASSLTEPTERPAAASLTEPTARPAAGPAPPIMYFRGVPVAGGVMSTAVIGGFRVHPDPGGDGVIQVLEGQKVVINATDVASRPPATQSYLIVNWGDGPNQRVGCGPCRLEHGYAPGRYTLEATADDLQPTAQAGSSTNRSISVVVEVLGRREVEEPAPAPFVSRFAAFGFYPAVLAIGDTALAVTPHPVPPGITLLFGDIVCADTVGTPDDSIIELLPGGWIVVPNGLAIAYEAISPGTCRFTQYATNNGTPFAETSTLTIR